MSDDQWSPKHPALALLSLYLFVGLTMLVAGVLAVACGTWFSQHAPEPCHDEVAVPGWPCDDGARVEVEDGVGVCRCPAASGQP